MKARAIAIVAAVLLTAPAGAAAETKTTVDPQADLGKYRTFVFLETDPKGKGAITDKLAQDRLRRLIASHLQKRGLQPAPAASAGELGVHFAGHVEPKQRVLMTGRPGPYSYNWGRAELGGQDTFDYREGALIVDLIDVSGNRLLWRTRISEAFTAGYSEENWKKIDRALEESFKKLPIRR
ncbi:MAG: DUF4136 domain-containing protein [Burkholderiales bacterium]